MKITLPTLCLILASSVAASHRRQDNYNSFPHGGGSRNSMSVRGSGDLDSDAQETGMIDISHNDWPPSSNRSQQNWKKTRKSPTKSNAPSHLKRRRWFVDAEYDDSDDYDSDSYDSYGSDDYNSSGASNHSDDEKNDNKEPCRSSASGEEEFVDNFPKSNSHRRNNRKLKAKSIRRRVRFQVPSKQPVLENRPLDKNFETRPNVTLTPTGEDILSKSTFELSRHTMASKQVTIQPESGRQNNGPSENNPLPPELSQSEKKEDAIPPSTRAPSLQSPLLSQSPPPPSSPSSSSSPLPSSPLSIGLKTFENTNSPTIGDLTLANGELIDQVLKKFPDDYNTQLFIIQATLSQMVRLSSKAATKSINEFVGSTKLIVGSLNSLKADLKRVTKLAKKTSSPEKELQETEEAGSSVELKEVFESAESALKKLRKALAQ